MTDRPYEERLGGRYVRKPGQAARRVDGTADETAAPEAAAAAPAAATEPETGAKHAARKRS